MNLSEFRVAAVTLGLLCAPLMAAPSAAVTCTACGSVHFVSARTGSVVAASRLSTSAIKGQPN